MPTATASVPSPEQSAATTARGLSVPFWVPVALFVFSGATGLVDQLCFSKYLTYIVGSTAHAVSAVLAAFMAGLAIGAHLGGRISSRVKRPFFAYGVLELVVALAVAVTPAAFAALTPLYVSLARAAPSSLVAVSVLRWCLAMLVVIVPTTAMGATLPLLSRALGSGAARDPAEAAARERRLGILYAANTFGGGLGALLAAYAVLPALGLRATLLGSAAISGAVGLAALVLGRSGELAPPERDARAPAKEHPAPALGREEPESRALSWLTVLAFASGCLVFAAEVVFTHLLVLVIGSSAYAFGLILAVFLSCLFLGASRAPALARRLGEAALPLSLVLAGLALALTLPIWDRLPLLLAASGEHVTSFEGREAVRALSAFLVLAVPVSLMGLTFPLLLQRVARYAGVGRLVGRLTAVNTIGAVAGSLGTGYLLLPLLGSQRMLALSATVFAGLGLATALGQPRRTAVFVGALATALVAWLAPRWDLARLTSGSSVYFVANKAPDEFLMMREDVHGGVTTVARTGSVLTLYTNGKFQGNNGWEMKAQRMFAHYPSLFVERFDRALVIGLGTGTTLGTLHAYPWRQVELVEISPSIVKAASTYFEDINHGALRDPRLELHLEDGRNRLLLSDRRYDLIGIEITSIWFAGAASLYSREFYSLVRQRLAPGGVFQQWVQLHHMSRRDLATVLHTLATEFEHVALFYGGGQGILVASEAPLRASRARVEGLAKEPRIRETLPAGGDLLSLLDDVLVTGAGLERYIEDTARESRVPVTELVSTDDNLYLEYATPRGNVLPWSEREKLVAELRRYRDGALVEALIVP